MRRFFFIFIIVLSICCGSCKKFVDIDTPSTRLTSIEVFGNDATATGAQLAVYAQMEADLLFFYLIKMSALSSDEMINNSLLPEQVEISMNDLSPNNSFVYLLWKSLYKYIYAENAILEGINRSINLNVQVAKQLKGEALFTRAYCYYLLAGFFGDLPWTTVTDYTINSNMGRTNYEEIFRNLSADLEEAIKLLDVNYRENVNGITMRRVRPNRFVAAALLVRIRMWLKEWDKAEQTASLVINSTQYSLENELTKVFQADSREVLWQLEPASSIKESLSGYYLMNECKEGAMHLRHDLPDLFQSRDKRSQAWITSIQNNNGTRFIPTKYRGGQGDDSTRQYTTLFRLGEMYLLRAEARLELNKDAEAIGDLDKIRERAGLLSVTSLNHYELRDSIAMERRRELFLEGDRWFDLRRTEEIDNRMGMIKPGSWGLTDRLYPIPRVEIERNRLLKQNAGY